MLINIIPPNGMSRPRDSRCEAHGIMLTDEEYDERRKYHHAEVWR